MCYPDDGKFECLPVFSPAGATGQIIDDELLSEQERLKEATKVGFVKLAECFRSKDWQTVLALLLEAGLPERVRLKAAEMIGDFGALEAIEPLRNHKFGNPKIADRVKVSIQTIHKRFYTRECPFCAEIIKKRAKICKHCGKEVAGQ
jgi:hypothetical protein